MLQNIRDKAQGWIAYGIVIMISVPFALWGIQQYLGHGSEPVAAKINGAEITQRALDTQFDRFRQQLRAQLGAAYRPEMFNDARMRTEVLNRMVNDELIQQVSHKMGLRVSDAMVQAALLGMKNFQKDGRFDEQTFERAVRLQGLTPKGFMERVRQLMQAQQLSQAVDASTFVTQHEAQEFQRLMNQKRELSYFVVPASDYLVDGGVSDEQIKNYYETHQQEFVTPERVKVDYIHLDAKSAGSTVKVTDEQLRNYYENNQDKFGMPEQRRASHILILVPKDADAAKVEAARKKIDEIAARIAKGEDFAKLAKEYSQDPGSAEKGGDLGFFGKGVMDPAFEAAVFSLKKDQVSKPVRSSFGFHLIKLTGIKAGGVKPFESIKPEVEQAYRKSEGERIYYDMANKLADMSYEDPTSLEPAATALGLKVQHSGWITREHADGVLGSPKALTAAFSDDVLQNHNNSELIELSGESSLVLRVSDHEEASTQPLDKVKDRIVEILRQQNAESQAMAEAEKRLQEIKGGSALQQAAGAFEVKGPLTVGRNDRSIPVGLSTELFRSAKPKGGKPTPGMVKLAGGDYAVYELLSVQENLDEKGAKAMAQTLRQGLERGLYDDFVADLRARADIEILAKTKSEE
ncbi:MAG: SurA N-terminal domain-containing protein [Candidatus Thiodiazotropha sp.]